MIIPENIVLLAKVGMPSKSVKLKLLYCEYNQLIHL